MQKLNLFYAEPDGDRWFLLDRFPRRIARRILRGPHRPGGQMRVFLNLKAGLDLLGIPYRINDYRHAGRHPDELCCILGKRHVLESTDWQNPLMIGPCVFDHPVDSPRLLEKHQVRRLLVPGEWMKTMCEPYWGTLVFSWPTGLDTDLWAPPSPEQPRDIDILVYDKLRTDQPAILTELLEPILNELKRRNLKCAHIKYGHYEPAQYRKLLGRARCLLFLSAHETQGFAYQEALASGVPVLAWDNAGYWTDTNYYPHKVKFAPVSSVPCWDDRCGVRFKDAGTFPAALDQFLTASDSHAFNPRAYILENLTLEKSADSFVKHVKAACSA